MSMKAYLQRTWPELLLVAVMATCLGLQAVQCFHIAPELALNVPLVAGVCCVAVLWLHVSACSLRCVAVGVPAFALACVAVALGVSGGDLSAFANDSYSNPVLVYPVLLLTAVAVFCLTRKKTTAVLLAIGGCVFCGAVEFLYVQELVAPTLVFMCAAIALLACRWAGSSSEQAGTFSFEGAKLFSVAAVSAIALLLACGVFFLVVAPLNPPVQELKLVTKYYALEEVHVSGYTELLHQRNEDLDSKNANDEESPSSQTTSETQPHEGDSQSADQSDDGSGTGGVLPDNSGDPMQLIRYFQEHWWLLLLALLATAALWAGAVAVRRALRSRRFARWAVLAPQERFLAQYAYVRSVLERVCKVSSAGMTPAEYANAAEGETAALERAGESVSFAQVSSAVATVVYGNCMPSEQQLAQAENYVRLLPKRLMLRFGRIKYVRMFFKV